MPSLGTGSASRQKSAKSILSTLCRCLGTMAVVPSPTPMTPMSLDRSTDTWTCGSRALSVSAAKNPALPPPTTSTRWIIGEGTRSILYGGHEDHVIEPLLTQLPLDLAEGFDVVVGADSFGRGRYDHPQPIVVIRISIFSNLQRNSGCRSFFVQPLLDAFQDLPDIVSRLCFHGFR